MSGIGKMTFDQNVRELSGKLCYSSHECKNIATFVFLDQFFLQNKKMKCKLISLKCSSSAEFFLNSLL